MSWVKWLKGEAPMPEEAPIPVDDDVRFSIRPEPRPDTESVTINALDCDLVQFIDRLAAAEGDPRSVFMRKRLLEGLGAYLSGKNRNAWKAYKLIGEARENF